NRKARRRGLVPAPVPRVTTRSSARRGRSRTPPQRTPRRAVRASPPDARARRRMDEHTRQPIGRRTRRPVATVETPSSCRWRFEARFSPFATGGKPLERAWKTCRSATIVALACAPACILLDRRAASRRIMQPRFERRAQGEDAMHVVVWLAAAGIIGGLLVLVAAARRNRSGDLGSVSGSWIAHHREN